MQTIFFQLEFLVSKTLESEWFQAQFLVLDWLHFMTIMGTFSPIFFIRIELLREWPTWNSSPRNIYKASDHMSEQAFTLIVMALFVLKGVHFWPLNIRLKSWAGRAKLCLSRWGLLLFFCAVAVAFVSECGRSNASLSCHVSFSWHNARFDNFKVFFVSCYHT